MATPTSTNVAIAKPRTRAAGAAHWGIPGEVTIPTNGIDPLDENFKDNGYLSQDGITNTIDQDFSDVIAFGGDRVLSVRTSRSESFQFGMIETNPESLALTYGPENVSVDAASGNITVKHNGLDSPLLVHVFEFALRGNCVKRIVVPLGQVTDIDDIQYQDGSEDPVTYTVTIAAMPDQDGVTAYEYVVYVGKSVKTVEVTAAGGAAPATTVQAGKPLTFAAKATYEDGSVAPITDGVTFASSDTKKATFAGNTLTGVAEGEVDVTASYGGETSEPVHVTITAAASAPSTK